jgi:hypothetical protein
MKNRADRKLVTLFDTIKKMQIALEVAEKNKAPQRYIERLEMSICALQQKVTR